LLLFVLLNEQRNIFEDMNMNAGARFSECAGRSQRPTRKRTRLGKGRAGQGLSKITCKGNQFCVENVCSYDPEAGCFTSYRPCFLTLAAV